MKKLMELNPGFVASEKIPSDIVYHEIHESPFSIHGLYPNADGKLCRLPEPLLPECNDGVKGLAWNLAGGRVRFSTDAGGIAIAAVLKSNAIYAHFAPTGVSGMEVFVEDGEGDVHAKTIMPQLSGDRASIVTGISDFCELPESGAGEMRTISIYLPLYNGVERMLIGLPPNAKIQPPRAYSIGAPVLFYGSSITQGGCASKAGTAYTAIVTRRLDADHVNLGFSGSARGEIELARHIASQKMSAFVFDYDHNAPSAEHLRETHEPFFEEIRRAQPELPVIFMTSVYIGTLGPDKPRDVSSAYSWTDKTAGERRDVIYATYRKAVDKGDKNVWFIDGGDLFGGEDAALCTVDDVHPNDFGFYKMANCLYPVLKEALGAR